MRVPIVRRNHVPAVDSPRAIAAMRMSPASCWSTPSLSSLSHSASNESGSAESRDSTNATNMRLGSKRKPNLSNRHIEGSAGGRSSTLRAGRLVRPLLSDEDVIHHTLLFASSEALRLQVEHGPVATAQLDQLVVGTELDDLAVLQHTDAVRVADRGEAVRDEYRRALARGQQDAI